MSTDQFKQVLFNDGEELTFQDLNNLQSFLQTRLADQVFRRLVPHINQGSPFDPLFTGDDEDAPFLFTYALTLHGGQAYLRKGSANNKIQISGGTLYQKIAGVDGVIPGIIGFTFDGTGDQFTIANGDATNPRVDLLQMKLEFVNDTPTTIAFLQDGVKSSIDLATHTTHDNTQLQAKVAGLSGNNISIQFQKRSSGSGVTYSENGNAALILYEDGVSTVALVEAAIIANSTILEIKATGTGATVLHDPADSFTYAHLTGGADQMLTNPTVNKAHRIQCTLSVKQGTPAASPGYPDPDAGYCVVGGVVVGATYAAAAAPKLEDTAGAVAVLHDQRMPFCVRNFRIPISNGLDHMRYDPSHWTAQYGPNSIVSDGADRCFIAVPSSGAIGRVLAVSLMTYNQGGAAVYARLGKQYFDIGGGVLLFLKTNDVSNLASGSTAAWTNRFANMGDFESSHDPAAGPIVQASGDKGIGPPLWTNGKRCPDVLFNTSSVLSADPVEEVAALDFSPNNLNRISTAHFWIAGGI